MSDFIGKNERSICFRIAARCIVSASSRRRSSNCDDVQAAGCLPLASSALAVFALKGQRVTAQGYLSLRLSPESHMSNQSRDGHGAVEVVKSLNPHQPLVDTRGSDSVLMAE